MKSFVLAGLLLGSLAAAPLAAAEPDGWGTDAELRAAAEGGDAEAQHGWAMRLWFGRGMARDLPAAVAWWQRAAGQGQADSQFWLGSAYELGLGVARDAAAAARWYRAAADQGLGVAQSSLGDLYAAGRGVPRDDAEALRWYRKGAEQFEASSQYALGEMYWKGQGVAADPVEATRWYLLAADSGFTTAQLALGEAYAAGRGRPKDLVCAYFWHGFAAKLGWEFAGEQRDALAPQLTAAELAQAQRMVEHAVASAEGPVQRPLCADETVSLHLHDAALADVLAIFEQLSGRRIVVAAGADSRVSIDAEDLVWTRALTEALDGVGLRWLPDGETLRVVAREPGAASAQP